MNDALQPPPGRMSFELLARDGEGRRGRLRFERGSVETPAFMPVGTYGTVKAMTPEELGATGAEMILGNTFHLMLRPGTDIIARHGGRTWAEGKPDRESDGLLAKLDKALDGVILFDLDIEPFAG